MVTLEYMQHWNTATLKAQHLFVNNLIMKNNETFIQLTKQLRKVFKKCSSICL